MATIHAAAAKPLGIIPRTSFSVGIILFSLFIGLTIPAYYDWSGADQSRPSPWIPGAALALLAGVGLVSGILAWMHYRLKVSSRDPVAGGWYCCLFAIIGLIPTSALALWQRPILVTAASYSLLGIVLLWCLWDVFKHARLRLPLGMLLATFYFPFLWIFVGRFADEFRIEMLAAIGGMPMIFPAGWIGYLFGARIDGFMWLANCLTAIVLATGLGLMHGGEKRTFAYSLLVVAISAMGSMALHSAIRA
jgi:hypothetical protein